VIQLIKFKLVTNLQ